MKMCISRTWVTSFFSTSRSTSMNHSKLLCDGQIHRKYTCRNQTTNICECSHNGHRHLHTSGDHQQTTFVISEDDHKNQISSYFSALRFCLDLELRIPIGTTLAERETIRLFSYKFQLWDFRMINHLQCLCIQPSVCLSRTISHTSRD